MMISSHMNLTRKQVNTFDRFLVNGTGQTLDALENMFGLQIERSDSDIEIAPARDSVNLKHIGHGTLYMVTCELAGDLRGTVRVLMRAEDFQHLGEVMRPVLSLLFLSSSDDELAVLDSRMPNWMRERNAGDEDFHARMMDTLAELGNVLIGLYSKAMFLTCHLDTHHSVPSASRDPDQQDIHRFLSATGESGQPQLVIENEFVVMDHPIKLWCLISPTRASFERLLQRIEFSPEYH
jgi:chemotaxis protein CheY-P-specific phosphatase CheC